MIIKKWHAKAIVQKIISILPFSIKINYFFQALLGNAQLSDRMFNYKLTHAGDHIKFTNELVPNIKKNTALELGTGWYPIVPLALYLTGYKTIISIDINKWLNKDNIYITIEKFIEWKNRGMLEEHIEFILPERWEHMISLLNNKEELNMDELCRKFNFHPKIADARNISFLNENSVDFICSNNTFEHIPPETLNSILIEFKRVLKPGGIMSHHIDLSDHFSNFDPSITKYNFLKYSDFTWKLIDNSIGFQNRLRFEDYKKMYNSLQIPFLEKNLLAGQPDLINRELLAKKYLKYSNEALAIHNGYLVSINR